jgi:hypothetical protein
MKSMSRVHLAAAAAGAMCLLASLPAIAGAQTQPSGVQSPAVQPVQLPRTGDAGSADTGALPLFLLGGGALVGGVLLRGRARRQSASNQT